MAALVPLPAPMDGWSLIAPRPALHRIPPSSALRSNTVLPEGALFTTIKSPLGWMASPVTGPASASQRKRVTFAAVGGDPEWGGVPPSKTLDWARASVVRSMGPLGIADWPTPASNRPVGKTPLLALR